MLSKPHGKNSARRQRPSISATYSACGGRSSSYTLAINSTCAGDRGKSWQFRKAYFDTYSAGTTGTMPRVEASRAQYGNVIRSMFGRQRRLPAAVSHDDTPERAEAQRQSINSPIQSCASDLNLSVLLLGEVIGLWQPYSNTIIGYCARLDPRRVFSSHGEKRSSKSRGDQRKDLMF